MATGDDAAAGGMDLVAGSVLANTIDTEITKSRDYIANGPTHWKPGVTLPASLIGGGAVPVANGGTGGTTAAVARSNLGIIASNVPTIGSNVQLDIDALAAQVTAANNNANARVAKSGDTMSGHLYLPSSVAATSGYTVAYINGDGRVSRGASSARYKDDITPIQPDALGDIFPELVTFIMKDDQGRTVRVGHIAETLQASPDQERFVVHAREPILEAVLDDEGNVIVHRVVGSQRVKDEDGNPVPESIDFISLLLAQTAQLHARIAELEAKADG